MKVRISKTKLSGSLTARPSKSYAHRFLIASALSNNKSTISNVDFSNDIKATLDCIYAYGSNHIRNLENHTVTFTGESTTKFNPVFDCKESGTTLRVFFPIAIQKYDNATFIGTDRLIERGIDIYQDTLTHVLFDKDKYSIKTKGKLYSGKFELPGNISSQYISGLLYALPLLDNDSEIKITTELESTNYILMTLDVLKKCGITIINNMSDILHLGNKNEAYNPVVFRIPGNQKYIANDFSIEGDYSNAAFIDAFNYFGSNITLDGLNPDSYQSDKIYKKHFETLSKGFSEIDISDCIDLGPILITFATLMHGAKFTNTKRLKIKESDRGNVIAEELRKCNADIDVLDNEIIVNKKGLSKPTILDSHNDHRIAMSLSLLSTQFDITIDDAECVSKSYPGYFDDMKMLGAQIYE